MNKRIFAKQPVWGLRFIVCIAVALLLIVLQHYGKSLKPVHRVLSFLTMPIQRAVNWPISMVDRLNQSLITHDALLKENLDMRVQLLLLQARMQRLLAVESENKNLSALLQSSVKIQGKVLAASLLAVDSAPFVRQIVIDKGKRVGVFVGQPVLDATGVMGQVMEVNAEQSRVLLVNDSQHAIPVEDHRNGLRAIAAGDSVCGDLVLQHVPKTEDIQIGDVFMSSSLGGRFPAGYPVGVVDRINKEPSEPFAEIHLKPSAHMNQSRLVLLIWPTQNTA